MKLTDNTFYRAVVTVILAIFLFDVQGAMIKHMGGRYPVEQIAFYRNLFGMIPHVLVLLLSSEWHRSGRTIKIERWQLAIGRGVLLIFAQVSFYSALVHMEMATATTLAFSGPLFVTTLSVPLLGHHVGWVRGAAVVLGFIGVVMVVQPGGDAFSAVALLPVAAAFFYALTSISARFFNDDDSTALISIYASVGALVAALVVVLINGSPLALSSPRDWLWFIAMGSVGGTAVFLLISAYRMTEPSNLSPFEYFGIPFSFLLGWWFFAETPFDSLFPGVLLIVGGGLLVVWRERRLRARKVSA
jgi:drug/metabolite transporter (DMT)-like permease